MCFGLPDRVGGLQIETNLDIDGWSKIFSVAWTSFMDVPLLLIQKNVMNEEMLIWRRELFFRKMFALYKV